MDKILSKLYLRMEFFGGKNMKIKKEFMLRNICGEHALVPVGETSKSFKGIIKVNDIGSFIWNNLEDSKDEGEIVSKIVENYGLDDLEAKKDVRDFIEYLKNVDII